MLTDVAQTCAGLVDGPSHDAPGRVFVVPRDLEASYLLDKIDGAAGIVGDRMPPGGSGRVAITQIGALRSWIADGAVCP